MTNKNLETQVIENLQQINQYVNYLYQLLLSMAQNQKNPGFLDSAIQNLKHQKHFIHVKHKQDKSSQNQNQSFKNPPSSPSNKRILPSTLNAMQQVYRHQISSTKQKIILLSKLQQSKQKIAQSHIQDESFQQFQKQIIALLQQIQKANSQQRQTYKQLDEQSQKIVKKLKQYEDELLTLKDRNKFLEEENKRLVEQNMIFQKENVNLKHDLKISMKYSQFFYKNITSQKGFQHLSQQQARQYRALTNIHQKQIEDIHSNNSAFKGLSPQRNKKSSKTSSPYIESIKQAQIYNQNLQKFQFLRKIQAQLYQSNKKIVSLQDENKFLKKQIQLLEMNINTHQQLKKLYEIQQNYNKKLQSQIQSKNNYVHTLLQELKTERRQKQEMYRRGYH